MFTQLYSVNKMQDTPRPMPKSHDFEKDNDVTHLERVTSETPPGEVEKGQRLAPIVSNGPVVHEKVGHTIKLRHGH
jgi:hypothetical protein